MGVKFMVKKRYVTLEWPQSTNVRSVTEATSPTKFLSQVLDRIYAHYVI